MLILNSSRDSEIQVTHGCVCRENRKRSLAKRTSRCYSYHAGEEAEAERGFKPRQSNSKVCCLGSMWYMELSIKMLLKLLLVGKEGGG